MESPKIGWSTTISQLYVVGIGGLPGCIYVGWNWPSPPENLTVRLKIDLLGQRGLGGDDNFGSGGNFGITLYRDGIWAEFDAEIRRNQHVVIGGVIAHEIIHALGRSGHSAAGFIDSSPMTVGSTYSNEGASYVVRQLKLPLR